MLLDAHDLLGGTWGWPRWTWTCAATATSRCTSWGRWPTRCCAVVMDRLRAEGRLLDGVAPPFRAADGRLVRVELVERPPFATLRAAA